MACFIWKDLNCSLAYTHVTIVACWGILTPLRAQLHLVVFNIVFLCRHLTSAEYDSSGNYSVLNRLTEALSRTNPSFAPANHWIWCRYLFSPLHFRTEAKLTEISEINIGTYRGWGGTVGKVLWWAAIPCLK